MGEGWTEGASDIVKAESSGEDPRATSGLVSNLPHPRVNKTKQHTFLAPEYMVPPVDDFTWVQVDSHCVTIPRSRYSFPRTNNARVMFGKQT